MAYTRTLMERVAKEKEQAQKIKKFQLMFKLTESQ